MAKIGIMGGTFNPIHNGHVKLAYEALEQLNLDKVWFMPSKNPPHKEKKYIASDSHRLNMIKIAIEKYKEFEVSDIELYRNGITYTSDTLEYLKKNYPNNKFYFILGADSLMNIEKWYNPKKLFELASYIVACRDDIDINILNNQKEHLKNKFKNADIYILNMKKVQVSSSDLRKYCRRGNLPHHNLDKNVFKYILNNDIYK